MSSAPCLDELAAAADEELVALARAGDDAALAVLLHRHSRVARTRARGYFLAGGDHDDVVQEGMIGLLRAVREFDPGQRASFRTFAELCVSRQILSAVRAATRLKHGPLNDYVPLHRPIAESATGQTTLGDLLPSSLGNDPAELVAGVELVHDLHRHVDRTLSELEVEVLRLHLGGLGYREIAVRLARPAKSVDNTLQRIRRKMGSYLAGRDLEVAWGRG